MLLDFTNSTQQSSRLGVGASSVQPAKVQAQPGGMSAFIGDDCAINELLEGRMDLDVTLPDGRKVRLGVERRTPMMDLLVQAASATKISPASHVIQVFADDGKSNLPLHYKPSTPIGTLDTNTISIVPKKDALDANGRRVKTNSRPFEPTFRVQVHLPRNQLTVTRVSPRVTISDLRALVCTEKGLDGGRYQLVRPSDPAQPLPGDLTLAQYGSTEITLLSNSCIESNMYASNSHIMPFSKRTDEQKRKTGILKLLAEDAKQKAEQLKCPPHCTTSFQTKSCDVQSGAGGRYKPRKRRPAPAPPPPTPFELQPNFHSRQSSSDSSGYHEATSSFLHEDHCHTENEKASSDSSGVSSLDAKMSTPEVNSPVPPININSKKKKAPPPPKESSQEVTHRKAPSPPNSDIKKPMTEPQNQKNNTLEIIKGASQKLMQEKDIIHRKQEETWNQKSIVEKKRSADEDIAKDKLAAEKKDISEKCNPSTKERLTIIGVFQNEDKNQKLTTQKENISEKEENQKNVLVKKETHEKPILPEVGTVVNKDILPEVGDVVNKNILNEKDISIIKDYPCTKDSVKLKDILPTEKDSDSKKETIQINDGVQHKDVVKIEKKSIPLEKGGVEKSSAPEKDIVKQYYFQEQDISQKKADQPDRKIDSKREEASENSLVRPWDSRNRPTAIQTSIEVKISQKKIEHVAQITANAVKKETNKEFNHLSSNQIAPTERKERKPEKITSELSRVRALIEQDVTQKEIASSIRAAFHSLEAVPDAQSPPPSAGVVDSDGEEFPPPPSQFRGDQTKFDDRSSLKRSSSLLSIEQEKAPRFVKTKSKNSQLQRSLSNLIVDDKTELEAEQEKLQQEYVKLQKQFLLWQEQVLCSRAMLREECLVHAPRTLRQSHSLPDGGEEDYPDHHVPPLVSRSLSYEPSTLPRTTINIPPLEFGGSVPLDIGSTTLRCSKTKSYFKPPPVRISTKSRQRLPPEVRNGLDVTDERLLSSILPSLESLIAEKSECNGTVRLKNGVPAPKIEFVCNGKARDNPNKLATLPKPSVNRVNGEEVKTVNGSSTKTECAKGSHPPPPPPLPPTNGLKPKDTSTGRVVARPNGVTKKTVLPKVDTREQLMNEIKGFGGRTALRKVSLWS